MGSVGETTAPSANAAGQERSSDLVPTTADAGDGEEDEPDGEQADRSRVGRRSRSEVKNAAE